MDRNPLK